MESTMGLYVVDSAGLEHHLSTLGRDVVTCLSQDSKIEFNKN